MLTERDHDRAEQLSVAALKLMQQQTVPPTPENYTVWYNFISESHPDIRRLLLPHLQSRREDSRQITQELYQQFFSSYNDLRLVDETGQQIIKTISGLSGHLTQAQTDVDRFKQNMVHTVTRIRAASSVEGATDSQVAAPDTAPNAAWEKDSPTPTTQLIEQLIKESVQIQAVNSLLLDEIENTSNIVKNLRENLKTAQTDSLHDSLTSIPNRRRYDHFTDQAFAKYKSDNSIFSLIVCDIDHFKRFNDAHGHKMGDQVLKLVAGELSRATLDHELAARIGGEEFAILLPGSTLTDALKRAEAIRGTIAQRQVRNKQDGKLIGKITLSLGVTEVCNTDTPSTLFTRADEALYLSKATGRNKVTGKANQRTISPKTTANL